MNRIMQMAFGAVAIMCTVATPALADLDEILKAGKIRIATNLAVPPMGMTDANNQPAGGDVEIGKRIAQDLGVEYELIPINGGNRVPYLQTNQADLTISTFGVTAERAKAVNFTNPYGYVDVILAGTAGVEITGPEDIAKYRIGVPRGSTQEGLILKLSPGLAVIRFDDDAATVAALLAGQVDAIGTSAAVIKASNEQNPNANIVQKILLDRAYWSIGVARSNPDLLHWLNTWIFLNRMNGFLASTFEKFIGGKMEDLPQL